MYFFDTSYMTLSLPCKLIIPENTKKCLCLYLIYTKIMIQLKSSNQY